MAKLVNNILFTCTKTIYGAGRDSPGALAPPYLPQHQDLSGRQADNHQRESCPQLRHSEERDQSGNHPHHHRPGLLLLSLSQTLSGFLQGKIITT